MMRLKTRFGTGWCRHNHIAKGRLCLIADSNRQLHWSTKNRLGRLEQAGGVMTLDPFAEKGIGHADFQRVTLTAQSKTDGFAEPKAEPGGAQTLGYSRAQRGFHDLRGLGQGLRPSVIFPLTRVSRHGALPANGAHTKVVRGRCPHQDWGRSNRRNASLEGVDSSERADMIEGLTHQRVPPAKGLCTPPGRLSKTSSAELNESTGKRQPLWNVLGVRRRRNRDRRPRGWAVGTNQATCRSARSLG
jgi:hypothetical protein